jgi:hypothetical protein
VYGGIELFTFSKTYWGGGATPPMHPLLYHCLTETISNYKKSTKPAWSGARKTLDTTYTATSLSRTTVYGRQMT